MTRITRRLATLGIAVMAVGGLAACTPSNTIKVNWPDVYDMSFEDCDPEVTQEAVSAALDDAGVGNYSWSNGVLRVTRAQYGSVLVVLSDVYNLSIANACWYTTGVHLS
jgi:hypothetical protein